MDVGLEGVKYPKNWWLRSPIPYAPYKFDEGNHRQLAHETPSVKRLPLMVRFAARLGLTKRNKSMMNALESAYSFISENYEPGDQLILYVISNAIDSDLDLKAAETLAKHLHDGTRPGDRPESPPSSRNNESTRQIPIYGVVVEVGGETRQMCEVNDRVKSKFPPGIEHIICYTSDGGGQSCATRLDIAGGIVSREICILQKSGWDLWIHCTKHVLYWKEDKIPEWDKDDPVWTQQLDSFPGGAQDGLGLGFTKPVGMYRHELRKCHRHYQRKDEFMLVWKSYRGVEESHS